MRRRAALETGAKVIPRRHRRSLLLAGVLVACSSPSEGEQTLQGASVEVLGGWDGAEADAFEVVLDEFEATTGAVVTYTSTNGADLTAVLDARIAAGDPPDVAVIAQPGVLARYARRGDLQPIDPSLAGPVAPLWTELATVDGDLYGVWLKAANKSLVWYALEPFEAAEVVPPALLGSFAAVAARVRASGIPAFAVAGDPADAWMITDLFENLYLRLAGTARYDALAAHRLPWTDASVIAALDAMAQLLDPAEVRAAGTATFADAVRRVFAAAPTAAMIVEGDFVPGVVGRVEPTVTIGLDVDAAPFPEVTATDHHVVGGGDAAVLLRRGPAADALVRYLGSADAGEAWAGIGGFVSPNADVDLRTYPDATTRRIARAVIEAGNDFRFDLSDLQPASFGGGTDAAMWVELRRFALGLADARTTAARLEEAAAAAWAQEPVTGG